jgi:non-canonical poly(A) RNA polymerase PAPD5/7
MEEDFISFAVPTTELEEAAAPVPPTLLTSLDTPPWMEYEVFDVSVPPLVRFHNEVLAFCEYSAPTVSELQLRSEIIDEIKSIVMKLWPGASVNLFGSQLTRILTPTSDIDIAVLDVPVGDGVTVVDCLYEIALKLREADLITYVEVISSAKVPIVKFDHKRTGVAADICINNRTGIDTGVLLQYGVVELTGNSYSRVGNIIRNYVVQFPPLRPLTMVLKMFLVRI